MKEYHALLNHVLEYGTVKGDRTGTGTKSVFGYQTSYDLAAGFPLVTTKKIHWKSVVQELLWFIRGETNIRPLLLEKVRIWSDWPHAKYVKATGDDMPIRDFEARIVADEEFAARWGELGPVYGKQWRRWQGHDGREYDQLADVVKLLRTSPDSRRIIMSAWNAADTEHMALPACHTLWHWAVSEGRLHCQLYQRSADSLLGVPFNIATAALLTQMLAQVSGLRPGRFVHTFGDMHIYLNHLDQVNEQLSREPRPLPTVTLDPSVKEIDDFRAEHIVLSGYDPHPAIKAPVAV